MWLWGNKFQFSVSMLMVIVTLMVICDHPCIILFTGSMITFAVVILVALCGACGLDLPQTGCPNA